MDRVGTIVITLLFDGLEFLMLIHKKKAQSGHALMIAILVATVLFTAGISITSFTTQDSKIAALEENESIARAAAEAGLEAAIGQTTDDDVNIGELLEGSGLSGDAVFSTEAAAQFTTPLISKDGQYTFYLLGYDSDTNQILTGAFGDDIRINRIQPSASDYCSGTQAFAVELTFIDATAGTGSIVQRYLIDECDLINGTTDEYDFADNIPSSSISPDPHIVIARIIAPSNSFDGAKIEFDNVASNNFPAQGRTVTSTASVGETSNENVTKKIRLFQSHPQFPAEFFVTSM